MADELTATQKANDDLKSQTLAAMAQGGQAAVDQFNAAQKQVQGYQNTALSSMAGNVIAQAAPKAAQEQLGAIVSRPGSLAQDQLNAYSKLNSSNMANQQRIFGNYMNQANAGVGAIRADADRQVGLMQERWRQQQAKEAAQKSDAELQQYAQGVALQQQEAARGNAQKQVDSVFGQRDSLLGQKNALDKQISDLQARAAASANQRPPNIPIQVWNANHADFQRDAMNRAVPPELLKRQNDLNLQLLNVNSSIQQHALDQATQGMDPRSAARARDKLIGGSSQAQLQKQSEAMYRGGVGATQADPQAVAHAQQAALEQMGIPSARASALVYNMNNPSAADQLKQAKAQSDLSNLQQYGTTNAANRFKQAATPAVGPDKAAAQIGISKDALGKLVNQTRDVKYTDANGKEKTDTDNVFDKSREGLENYLKQGYSIDVAAQLVAQHQQKDYGHAYPQVLSVLMAMYGSAPQAAGNQ